MEILKNSEKRWLRYDFTAVEINDLSMDLANTTQQIAAKQDEKKSVVSQFKAKIDELESKTGLLANKVSSGYEIREVECEVLYHKPEQGKKTMIRSDNKQKIVEKITSEEWNLFNQEKDTDHGA